MSRTVVGYFGYSNRSHKTSCTLMEADPLQCTVEVNDYKRKTKHKLTYDRLTLPDGQPLSYSMALEMIAKGGDAT